MSFFNPFNVFSATIDDTESVSEDVNLGGLRAFGVNIPAAPAATNITFEVSDDGTNWLPLFKEDNTELSLAITAESHIGFGALIVYFSPWQYVRVVSDTVASGDEEYEIVARHV